MLSDRDRAALTDIERKLSIEDPQLVRRFTQAARALRRGRESVLSVLLGVALLLTAFAILLGAAGQAFALGTLTAALAGMRYWLCAPPRAERR